MSGETVGVSEDAATNHETVDGRVLMVKFESVGAVANIAVNDKLGFGTNIVAHFNDIWD